MWTNCIPYRIYEYSDREIDKITNCIELGPEEGTSYSIDNILKAYAVSSQNLFPFHLYCSVDTLAPDTIFI
jgi:hypothetical protein